MDNHGAEATGEIRLFATTEWLNIREKGHRLLIGALRSEGPDSTLYGLAEYELPVTKDGKGKLKATVSRNEFSVGESATLPEIVGETDNAGFVGSYQFIRSRTLNIGAQAAYTYKDVLFDVDGIQQLSTDQQIELFIERRIHAALGRAAVFIVRTSWYRARPRGERRSARPKHRLYQDVGRAKLTSTL